MDLFAAFEVKGEEVDDQCSRALVVVMHGLPLCLVWRAEESIEGMLSDCSVRPQEPFALEGVCGYAKLADGIYIGHFELVDDGPSDWPGAHEWSLDFVDERRATAEEWKAHLDDLWPWAFERSPARAGDGFTIHHRTVSRHALEEGWQEREGARG